MEAKLRQLMKHEGINSTRLAEILGIQASGISHIMSGRNKPSFDFLHKLLQRFPQINPDWLLLDKGQMYRDEVKNKGGQTSLPTGAGNRAVGSVGSDRVVGGGYGGDGTINIGSGFGAAGVNDHGGVGLNDRGAAESPVDNFAGRISADNRQGAMISDVDLPYRRSETVVHSGGDGSGSERNRPSGGLFGPDNNDIIPSSGNSGGHTDGTRPGNMHGSRPGHTYDAHSGQYREASRSGAAAHSAHTPAQAGYASEGRAGYASGGQASAGWQGEAGQLPLQATQQNAQQEDYQSNILKRSAFIERIVVFYKDKTFSEYQPE